jgi:hypothetical protein
LEKINKAFPETKYYREYLEFKHLKGQNQLVAFMVLLMMILTVSYMFIAKYQLIPIISFGLGFLLILIFNYALTAYSQEHYYYLKLNKYITSVGLFTLVLAMIIYLKSPSLIPLFFVVYAISSIYKDIRILLIVSIYFLFSSIMLLINFQYIFNFEATIIVKDLTIGFFVILFLIILLLSSYIIVKEKTFFYQNIALAKEKEYRSLELLLNLQEKGKPRIIHNHDYYEKTKKFLKEFSENNNIKDLFTEKLIILQKLENNQNKEAILSEHQSFDLDDLDRLENLLLHKNSYLQKLILKLKHSQTAKFKTKEIFSATHFQSFNKQNDYIETKILCFVVYYAALRKGFLGLKPINADSVYDILSNSEFSYLIDSRVLKIYEENSEVFEQIVKEVYQEVNEND